MNSFQEQFTVKANTARLIETLKANKEKHRAHFLKALEGWRKESVEKLTSLAKKIEGNKDGNRFRHITIIDEPPMDMTHDYEVAIDMLSWNTTETIDLDQQKFNAFVRDDWHWSGNWTMSNSKYLG